MEVVTAVWDLIREQPQQQVLPLSPEVQSRHQEGADSGKSREQQHEI